MLARAHCPAAAAAAVCRVACCCRICRRNLISCTSPFVRQAAKEARARRTRCSFGGNVAPPLAQPCEEERVQTGTRDSRWRQGKHQQSISLIKRSLPHPSKAPPGRRAGPIEWRRARRRSGGGGERIGNYLLINAPAIHLAISKWPAAAARARAPIKEQRGRGGGARGGRCAFARTKPIS